MANRGHEGSLWQGTVLDPEGLGSATGLLCYFNCLTIKNVSVEEV